MNDTFAAFISSMLIKGTFAQRKAKQEINEELTPINFDALRKRRMK